MTRFGLVGCVKTKRSSSATAAELYTSPLFIGRRRYVEASCERWFILSAEHGLLRPDDVIEPYDRMLGDLTPSERWAWSTRVLAALQHVVGDLAGPTFEVHAGATYRNNGLVEGLQRAGAVVEVPAEGLNQGQQLAYYSSGSWPTRPVLSSKYGALQVLLEQENEERRRTLSFAEIEVVLGRPLPPSARNHCPWWGNTNRAQASAWMNAGWRVTSLDTRLEQVTFERATPPSH